MPAKLDYETWLRRQPARVQDFALGRERGQIFRADPRMEIARFTDSMGRRLTLKELQLSERNLL